MNMANKEELVIENTRLKDKLALYREINHRQACIIKESLELNKPCQEYALYKPQPYKFEDLKPNMWVWDDVDKVCRKLESTAMRTNWIWFYIDESEKETIDILFEEGRFFPVIKAMQYQGKEDKNA